MKKLNNVKNPHFLYYNKCEIQVVPIKLKELSRWGVKLVLFRHRGDKVNETGFICDTIYKSEKEAIKHGLLFGKNIVDNKVPKKSIKN